MDPNTSKRRRIDYTIHSQFFHNDLLSGSKHALELCEANNFIQARDVLRKVMNMGTHGISRPFGPGFLIMSLAYNMQPSMFNSSMQYEGIQFLHDSSLALSCCPVEHRKALEFFNFLPYELRTSPSGLVIEGSWYILEKTQTAYCKAAERFFKSAFSGHPLGQNNYGLCLLHGLGVKQNAEEAENYFRMAVKQGCCVAMTNLCKVLCTRVNPNYEEVLGLLKYNVL